MWLGIAFFILLSVFDYRQQPGNLWLLNVAFWVYLVGGLTDILDGYLARLLKQVTSFGRIVDPFVDKVMVCGGFGFLSSAAFYDPHTGVNVTGVAPWMVVVIIARELLMSTLRAHSEAQGRVFAAQWAGKLKMFLQSFAICSVLGVLAFPPCRGWDVFMHATVWLALTATVLSALVYLPLMRASLWPAGEDPA
jgi:CDP-diacylglycerol--glycerol-3-phosphate 3-phosphatidyltransferase